MASGDLVPRIYTGFRGVDFRGEDVNLTRSPDALNVWKDYTEIDSIRTRPTLKKIHIRLFGDDKEYPYSSIYGLHHFIDSNGEWRGRLHIKNNLFYTGEYLRKNEDTYLLYSLDAWGISNAINENKSVSFFMNGGTYILDGKNIFFLAESGGPIGAYIPTTSIGRKPAGGGTMHEDINLLTGERINTFLADGESTEYFLDSPNIDEDYSVVVKVNDEEVLNTEYTLDFPAGKITFLNAPTEPLTDGQDNVSIQFCKTIPGNREKITNCTIATVFDNRVFFSGNKNYPNTVWHCSLDNTEYFSDLDYYNEGSDTSAIKAMVAGNNALWVIKETSQGNNTIFYHTPTIDSEYGKIYPSTHSNISVGCVGQAINFNDDIVFFSERGMEGISGDITSEQVLSHRSSLIDAKLLAEPNYKNMILQEWKGYLLVFIDNHVYLADSRAKYTNGDHFEYEWYYWELDKKITCSTIIKGELWLGTDDGLYTLTDFESDVKSHWVTPKDNFKHPQYLKTTNKRGCVSEATGDIDVYAKTDKTEFELIGNYKNVKDSFVSRIKRKKFKDIQLKFSSNTRFSLESTTLECFIGGYIKR